MWKISVALCAATIAITIGIWIAHGSNIFTKDKVQVIVKTTNPDFGIEEEHIEWKDEFHLGLDIAGPVGGIALIGALGSFVMMRRQSLKAVKNSLPV